MTADSMDKAIEAGVPASVPINDGERKATATESVEPTTVLSSEEKTELVLDDEEEADLFSPLPDVKNAEPEGHPLTVRAVLVGLVLGSLVNASNVYLGTFLSSQDDSEGSAQLT